MSVAKPFVPNTKQLSDEVRLIALMEQNANSPAKDLEDEIIALVDEHFRESLRPVLIKTFGPTVASQQLDASVRYTNVVNDFFAKVLKHRNDAFWQAKTAKELRSWASRVMTNQVLDHFRRKKLAPKVVDDIGAFADQRQTHFEKYNNDVRFETALATLERWTVGSDDERHMALVLQHRYIDGMSYDEIAEQLDISKPEAYRIAEKAKKRLRDEASRDE